MSEYIISFENVSYVYSEGTPNCKTALDKINLNIKKGSVTGIIGHTGSGKSTLLQLMNGLLKPKSGRVLFDGNDINAKGVNIKEIRSKVGLVFQYPEYQLFEETVYKDVAYGPKNMGLSDEQIRSRVEMAFEFTDLPLSYAEKSPFDLSGGEKRRAAIAGIIAMEPELLVLDEPAAGLDPVGKKQIFDGVIRYKESRPGTSVIIVSHSMEDMAVYCDDLIVFEQGRLIMSGKPCEVFSKPEKLREIGLDIPQIGRVLEILRENGIDIREGIFTVKDAANEIKKLLSGGKNAF